MGFRNLGQFLSFVREGWEQAFLTAKFFCSLHIMQNYLVVPTVTFGPSMLPAIDLDTSVFLTEKITTRFGKVSRGDIVVLMSPIEPGKYITKRLVGMEGDNVTYNPSPDKSDELETVVVPKGHVWVEGDNPYHSRDSRSFGPVPFGLIRSRLFWKVWPSKDFGPFWKH